MSFSKQIRSYFGKFSFACMSCQYQSAKITLFERNDADSLLVSTTRASDNTPTASKSLSLLILSQAKKQMKIRQRDCDLLLLTQLCFCCQISLDSHGHGWGFSSRRNNVQLKASIGDCLACGTAESADNDIFLLELREIGDK